MTNKDPLKFIKSGTINLPKTKHLKWLSQNYYVRDWLYLPVSIGKSVGVLFPPSTSSDFNDLKTSSGTLFASRGHLFKDAVFGGSVGRNAAKRSVAQVRAASE